MSVTKRFKALNCIAWSLCAIGMAAMTAWDTNTGRFTQVICEILYGLGGGILYPGRIYAVQASLPSNDIAIGTTMVAFMTSLGEAFGVCIGGAILQNSWTGHVDAGLAGGSIPQDKVIPPQMIESAQRLLGEFPGSLQYVYRLILSQSLASIWLTMSAFSVVGVVVCLVGKNYSLDQDESSEPALDDSRFRSVEMGTYSRLQGEA
jgi:hypothetical protein